MDSIWVKPGAGRMVRNELTNLHIPESGAEVPLSELVRRRLADGDLVQFYPQREPAQGSETPAPKLESGAAKSKK